MQDDGEQISTYAMSYACQDLQSIAVYSMFPSLSLSAAFLIASVGG